MRTRCSRKFLLNLLWIDRSSTLSIGVGRVGPSTPNSKAPAIIAIDRYGRIGNASDVTATNWLGMIAYVPEMGWPSELENPFTTPAISKYRATTLRDFNIHFIYDDWSDRMIDFDLLSTDTSP